ncbi:rhombotin-1 isoform X2 [Cuculus canorus]|uniref:rhombotin-1 isoform X2 n=1 Tax=Cuculus canorus TaxID=55661 RepID=UPI0023AAB046|nr:rhombotin-1 isoform X2 [Cuculus canorus]XP_053923469.1 rhombotin-1 isoform X2 [Cuculus canorus]
MYFLWERKTKKIVIRNSFLSSTSTNWDLIPPQAVILSASLGLLFLNISCCRLCNLHLQPQPRLPPKPPAPILFLQALKLHLTGVPMLSVQPKGKQKGCAGCNRKIKDRYLLKALDKYWHEDCLKCACCDCRLGEVGSTLYTKANLILCRRDYLRLFGTTGNCAACSKLIPAFEMVMRARDNVYHLDCFACQLCNQRFCVGDKFFLKNNMILCQMDYEEGQLNGSFESQVQ